VDWNNDQIPLVQRVLHLWRLLAVKSFLLKEKLRARAANTREHFDLFTLRALPMPGEDWRTVPAAQEVVRATAHHVTRLKSLRPEFRLLAPADVTDTHIRGVFPHLFSEDGNVVSPHHDRFWRSENSAWMRAMFDSAIATVNDNAHLFRADQKLAQLINLHGWMWQFYYSFCSETAADYDVEIERSKALERARIAAAQNVKTEAEEKEEERLLEEQRRKEGKFKPKERSKKEGHSEEDREILRKQEKITQLQQQVREQERERNNK
jgi:hypothetical protein